MEDERCLAPLSRTATDRYIGIGSVAALAADIKENPSVCYALGFELLPQPEKLL
jgi:hypothetical protein